MTDLRLGEVHMPDSCMAIQFGRALFVKTDQEGILDGGGRGVVFEATDRYVIEHLDIYNPRRTTSAKPGRPAPPAETVQARPAASSEGASKGE